MQSQPSRSMSTFAMLVSLGVSSSLFSLVEGCQTITLAQPSPQSTTLRIDNLTRMAPINQALKQQYEAQFPNSSLEIRSQQPQATLQLPQNGANSSDLTAISRFLTAEEKARGLVQIPVTREKIAIVVGQNNPYTAELTIDQVVKIFRREITDWSQLGGNPGPIRVIHRPMTSNLQTTLQTYDLLELGDFKAGEQNVQLDQNHISALSDALGQDGISYVLASQIKKGQAVRPVSMYNTLPDDPRYPFSQPFTYIYQGAPTASTKAFLNYVASEQGQAVVAKAKAEPALFENPVAANTSTPAKTSNETETARSSISKQENPQPSESRPPHSVDKPPAPVASNSAEVTQDSTTDSSGNGWLPITLILLVLGGLVGGILKTLFAKNPKTPPRPAPNYAEKIKSTRIQGKATELQAFANVPMGGTDRPPVSSEKADLNATDATLIRLSEAVSEPTLTNNGTQGSSRLDITSKELQAETHLQSRTTELQDTRPSTQGTRPEVEPSVPLSPLVDQAIDTEEMESAQPASSMPDTHLNPTQDLGFTGLQEQSPTRLQHSPPPQLQDPSPTQLQDEPSLTVLQEQTPTQLQHSPPPQLQDLSPTQLHDDSSLTFSQDQTPTPLQETSLTALQDQSPTRLQHSPTPQLQDPSPTQLQDSKLTWSQEVDFPNAIDLNESQAPPVVITHLQESQQTIDPKQTWTQSETSPQGQDPNATQLQEFQQTIDPKQTWTQSEGFPQGQDPHATHLQESQQTIDPKQTWTQSEGFPQGQDPHTTHLQEPQQTIDPKQTWTQDETSPQGQDPNATQLQDPKQTWIQTNERFS